MLTFDPTTHEYRVQERLVPSVTKLIKAAGLIDDTWMDEEALARGSIVHQALEYDDQGDLDEGSIDPRIMGYVEAWRKCRQEMGLEVVANEQKVYHETYRYAGTLDRVVRRAGQLVLIDLKSGSPAAWHALQLALYLMATEQWDINRPTARAAVYLEEDGRYKYVEHKDRNDFAAAKAVITLFNWSQENAL
jgi:hypothetical protein